MNNTNSEQFNPENNPEHSMILTDAFGIHESPKGQHEDIHNMMEQIGEHEERIINKLDKTNLNEISPKNKKSLSFLGSLKRIFASKTLEQKYEEKRDFIISHNVKKHTYFNLKGGEDMPDNEISKKYVEIASTGIPKIIKNEAGEPIDVVDATRYQNIS